MSEASNRPLWSSAEVVTCPLWAPGSQKQSMHIRAQTKLPMGEEALTLGRVTCRLLRYLVSEHAGCSPTDQQGGALSADETYSLVR